MIINIKPWLEMADENGQAMRDFYLKQEARVALSSDSDLDELQLQSARPGAEQGKFGMTDRMDFYHKPVLGNEVLHAMRPVRGKQVFDGTLGGGGHTEMLLQGGAHVIGCDQDEEALAYATRRMETYGDCFLPVRGNFSQIDQLLGEHGIEEVDGVLMDLGVSSHQLDEPGRGFSFRADGPLDMRMDQRGNLTAADLVNGLDEEELADVIYQYGEERGSRKIAKAIVDARKEKRIEKTLELVKIVETVVPRVGPKNPATRVFQALRIKVNRELEVLEEALEKATAALSSGGVLAIITFHSLEDRIVKHFMKHRSMPMLDRPEWPEPRENPDHCLSLRNRKAIVPTEEEINQNPRARSAKLRVAIKI